MTGKLLMKLDTVKYTIANHTVTTPARKFMAEFVMNKAQRLTFDLSSPNGILLFREVSKLLVAYGTRLLAFPNPADIYAYKYKGIWISLTILARALAGNYVNFGVFELYGDRALSDALDIALKMTLSIPLADVLAFPKIFADLKAQILASQAVDQHQRLSICFDKLMADVSRSLDSKNKDKFTQNLTVFRNEFRVK